MRWTAIIAVALLGLFPMCAVADPNAQKRSWSEEKCFRYQRDWTEALHRWGSDGIGPEFVAANETFIRHGCHADQKICPHTARERELVDVLAIRVVNEGMSSTFLPFDCSN